MRSVILRIVIGFLASGACSGDESKSQKAAFMGSWTLSAGKLMAIQHFQGGKFFAARIERRSKIIVGHSCGDLECYSGEATGFSFTIEAKFATKNWENTINRPTDSVPVTFEGLGSHTRRTSNRVPPDLETWKRQGGAETTTEIDGVWQHKAGLREFVIKSYHSGRVYTSAVDAGTSKVRGASIGNFRFADGKLSETIEFATDEWKERIGKTFEATVSKEGAALELKDKRGMTEKWDRVGGR
jgi:hypothetical protein